MQCPFALHLDANGTAFQEFIPIDSVLFSRECLDRSFVSSSTMCDECGNHSIALRILLKEELYHTQMTL